jgi:hypothetical protein
MSDLDPRMRQLTFAGSAPKRGLRSAPITVVHWLKTLAWQGAVPPQAAAFRWRKATISEQWEAHHAFCAGQDGTSQEIFAPVFAPFWHWDRSVSHSLRIERDILHALTRKYVSKEPDVVTALLRRALAVALRMREEAEKFNEREMFRLERGEAYARWMLTGAPDRDMLLRACQLAMQDAKASLLGNTADGDDSLAGSFVAAGTFLEAARVALIVKETDLAQEALRRCPVRSSPVHDQLRQALVQAADATRDRALKSRALIELGKIFDKFRPPKPRIDTRQFWLSSRLTAFELGVIHTQIAAHSSQPINLEIVYGKVSAP